MDIKEYIESGILESYVLGFASPQEIREVECMSAIYPELKQELVAQQTSIEKFVTSIAVTPPYDLKTRIFEKIQGREQEGIAPAKVTPTKEEAKIVPMANPWIKYVAAASVVGLLVGAYFYTNLNVEKTNLTAEVNTLNQELTTVKEQSNSELSATKEELRIASERQDFILNSNTSRIDLGGTDVSPDSRAIAYYNANDTELLLVSDALPTPEEGKQFQLWAIADGKPVDLGVLAKNEKLTNKIDLSQLQNIQAFAITLEKDGGSPTPNLEQLYVIGNVAS